MFKSRKKLVQYLSIILSLMLLFPVMVKADNTNIRSNIEYEVKTPQNQYMNAYNAKDKKAPIGKISIGKYYIYKESMGMVNLSKTRNVPGAWINPSEGDSGKQQIKPVEPSKPSNPSKPSTPSVNKDGKYRLDKGVKKYITAFDAEKNINSKGLMLSGDYYIFSEYRGMINITKKAGVPGAWINPNDNTANLKPSIPVEKNETLIATDYVNMRRGSSTNYSVILTIPKNAEVEASGKKDGSWIEIKYKGNTGWSHGNYFKESSSKNPATPEKPTDNKNLVEATGRVNFRTGPSTKYSSITKIQRGQVAYATGKRQNNWIELDYNNRKGWASKNYFKGSFIDQLDNKPSSPNIDKKNPVKASSSVNMRTGSSTSYSIITLIRSGETAYATGKVDKNWMEIEYQGKKGWSSMSYFEGEFVDKEQNKVESKPNLPNNQNPVKSTANVNMRTGGSTQNSIIRLIYSGQTAYATGKVDKNWMEIEYQGQKGWVSMDYFSGSFVEKNKYKEDSNTSGIPNTSSKFILALDPGHGAGQAHNRGGVLFNEGDQNYRFSQTLTKYANRYRNVQVVNTRSNIYENPSLSSRASMVGSADLFLSLHTNAAVPSARGVEVYNSFYNDNYTMASEITNMVSRTLGTPNRGVKYKYYSGIEQRSPYPKGKDYWGVFRGNESSTKMIIEFVFHTNYNDSLAYLNNQEILAQKLMEIIANNYGLVKK